MGTKSRRSAALRTERKRLTAELERRDAEFEAHYPDELAKYTDDAVLARVEADRAGQERRLRAAGFILRATGRDGIGVWDNNRRGVRFLHSVSRENDGRMWAHESISHRLGDLPGWYEVRDMHRLLYPDLNGVLVVTTEAEHVNLSQVHHVWTCLDGPVLPDFRKLGEI